MPFNYVHVHTAALSTMHFFKYRSLACSCYSSVYGYRYIGIFLLVLQKRSIFSTLRYANCHIFLTLLLLYFCTYCTVYCTDIFTSQKLHFCWLSGFYCSREFLFSFVVSALLSSCFHFHREHRGLGVCKLFLLLFLFLFFLLFWRHFANRT